MTTQPLAHPILQIGATREETLDTKATQGVTHMGATPMISTPVMIGLMEGVCMRMLQEKLPKPQTSVGTVVNIRHLAAAPAGQPVRIAIKFVQCEGRRYTWEVQAFSGDKKIGDGLHERAVIDPSRFQTKGAAKA
ncbi:MAG: thioesterase [Dehalococcoidia bacterium]|nr:thioesterase [Dehalococcoidia bacterium]